MPITQVVCEPPYAQWPPLPQGGLGRDELTAIVNDNARQLGTGNLVAGRALIATGHQAWLWHPGVLAKDIAASQAAAAHHAGAYHLVVDHDPVEPLRLALPVNESGRLTVMTVNLGPHDPEVPPACQPAVKPAVIRNRLQQTADHTGSEVAAGLSRLTEAFSTTGRYETLGQQMGMAINQLRRRHCGEVPVLFSSQLMSMPAFQRVIRRMMARPRDLVSAYNRAVRKFPDAGVPLLAMELDRVELPLWLLAWGRPRQRVFADLAGDPVLLTLEDGTPIDHEAILSARLASAEPSFSPKALLMTALLRSSGCDYFIHGKGGALYERINDHWWPRVFTEPLAPYAVVSADVTLPLDAPLADQQAWDRAVWRAHHLPHNVERERRLGPHEAQLARRKHKLVSTMKHDRNRSRRSEAFSELRRINQKLADSHPELISEAEKELEAADLGLANRQIATRRDWCFALYPPESLDALPGLITSGAQPAEDSSDTAMHEHNGAHPRG